MHNSKESADRYQPITFKTNNRETSKAPNKIPPRHKKPVCIRMMFTEPQKKLKEQKEGRTCRAGSFCTAPFLGSSCHQISVGPLSSCF